MPPFQVSKFISVLQVAVGPVILISGVGLLLLTLTNRLGRAIDRARHLGGELRRAGAGEKQRLQGQVEIIYRRAKMIRASIMMAVLCMLLVSVLIIVLFVSALMEWEAGSMIAALFIGAVVSLILCLSAFIRDIQLSLEALVLELEPSSTGTDDSAAS